MKSSDSKENQIASGDYELIAEGLGISPETVRKVKQGYRTDKHKINKAFQILSRHKSKSRALILNKLKALNPQPKVAA